MDLLPPELQCRILSFLHPRDIGHVAQSCRRLSAIATDPSLWVELATRGVLLDIEEQNGLRAEEIDGDDGDLSPRDSDINLQNGKSRHERPLPRVSLRAPREIAVPAFIPDPPFNATAEYGSKSTVFAETLVASRLKLSLRDWLPHGTEKEFFQALYKVSTSPPPSFDILGRGVYQSSADHDSQSISATLDDHPHAFWSSTGSDLSHPSEAPRETLVYAFVGQACVVQEITVQWFTALFQLGSPWYGPFWVRFSVGYHEDSENDIRVHERSWTGPGDLQTPSTMLRPHYVSPYVPVRTEQAVTIFKPPTFVSGSYLRIDMYGRSGQQPSDMKRYVVIGRVQCLGWTSSTSDTGTLASLGRSSAKALALSANRIHRLLADPSTSLNQPLKSLDPPPRAIYSEFYHRYEIRARDADVVQALAQEMRSASSQVGVRFDQLRSVWSTCAGRAMQLSSEARSTRALPLFLEARSRQMYQLHQASEVQDVFLTSNPTAREEYRRRRAGNAEPSSPPQLTPEDDPTEYYFRLLANSGLDVTEKEGVAMIELISSHPSFSTTRSTQLAVTPQSARFRRLLSENRIVYGKELGDTLWKVGDFGAASTVWFRGNVVDRCISCFLHSRNYSPLIRFLQVSAPNAQALIVSMLERIINRRGYEEGSRFAIAVLSADWSLRHAVCQAIGVEVRELESRVRPPMGGLFGLGGVAGVGVDLGDNAAWLEEEGKRRDVVEGFQAPAPVGVAGQRTSIKSGDVIFDDV
ncbi:hypothetical protein M427DRAFT_70272 [Gonapodya prolifera JEL478]|uniref:F-box domain-containing protein n=1 Tax=Gonapodya prolifera (strain JEL478) TaxID=1344416 RepID=A0A139AEB8_GONPJ|nr:hypothetical protein M427DRAFT_70272 [Gonapodya prolifera JEL478]|eukprot:KXS14934.1 hypothetical protein M427DRAFT_70272 [Gonapodya prolifera JEL478]